MTVILAPELEKIVNERISTGSYDSPGDVVDAALRLLDAQDREKLEALRRDIAISTEQFERGDYTSYSSAKEFVEEIKTEGRQSFAERAAKSA
jgi:putative addiction module CopG family antidote